MEVFYMINMKEMTLKHILYEVQEAAMSLQTEQLARLTKEISKTNLLHVFALAKQMNKDRTFWTNSTNDFSLVGIGSNYKLFAYKNRYHQIEHEWNHLVERAFVYT